MKWNIYYIIGAIVAVILILTLWRLFVVIACIGVLSVLIYKGIVYNAKKSRSKEHHDLY